MRRPVACRRHRWRRCARLRSRSTAAWISCCARPARTEVHRLDLNPETDASRRAAFRKRAGAGARWAFRLLSAIVLVAVVKVVVREAFVDNPKFLLQHIEVLTAGPVGKSAIESA